MNGIFENILYRWRSLERVSVPADLWRGAFAFLCAGILWEVLARYVIASPLFFSPLTDIAAKAISLWQAGELQVHIWVSFVEFAIGYGLSAVLGIAFGMVLAGSRTLRSYFDPLLSMLYATPIIALGPIFIMWLGIGISSKVAIIFLTAVFPILINTVAGLTTTDRNLVDVARSFGASQTYIYLKIRTPSALPFIIAGLRLSVARALVGVVIAEMFGARAGLGFLIFSSAQSFDTASVFVGVVILAFAGVVSVEFLKWLEFKLAPWRREASEE
jgi:NitT/TauT family transport system permease protein